MYQSPFAFDVGTVACVAAAAAVVFCFAKLRIIIGTLRGRLFLAPVNAVRGII